LDADIAATTKPIVVFMHHIPRQPIEGSADAWFDATDLAALIVSLNAATNLVLVCGHLSDTSLRRYVLGKHTIYVLPAINDGYRGALWVRKHVDGSIGFDVRTAAL
jgi:hypothetical protein